MNDATLRIAVIGAGPVGLALALHAARTLPQSTITLFDARPLEKDVSGDPRTLALSLGSVQLLARLGVWRDEIAEPIRTVHVSQQPPSLPWLLAGRLPEPELAIRADDEGVPFLGAVLTYGAIVAELQRAWLAAASIEPRRLFSRFDSKVAALKDLERSVEVDAGIAERFDLAVVAEGGVFVPSNDRQDANIGPGDRSPTGAARSLRAKPLHHDYRQTAWVGQVGFEAPSGPPAAASATGSRGTAFERFTRHGPAALLPLPDRRAALVWCVSSDDDPVADLGDAQRIAVLNSVFHPAVGKIASISPLKAFPLGLRAEPTLVDGHTVRIGNAAQTLHPVAGQGLNLGLRDAFELVEALARAAPDDDVTALLRRLEWQRAPDRWAMIAATDFLARSFTWRLPGAGAARGLGLAALAAVGPARTLLARQMMYGSR